MIRTFMPDMIEKGQGNIVAMASALAYEPSGRCILYSASKYGIRGLMDSLFDMIHMDNLDINLTTVCPLLVNSRKDLLEHFRMHGA